MEMTEYDKSMMRLAMEDLLECDWCGEYFEEESLAICESSANMCIECHNMNCPNMRKCEMAGAFYAG